MNSYELESETSVIQDLKHHGKNGYVIVMTLSIG